MASNATIDNNKTATDRVSFGMVKTSDKQKDTQGSFKVLSVTVSPPQDEYQYDKKTATVLNQV